MKQISLFWSIVSLLVMSFCMAQEKEAPIPLDPKVRYGQLENGFTYYIRNYQKLSGAEKAGILVKLIGPGSRFEDEDQLGLAHLIEHMVIETNTSSFDSFYDYFNENLKHDYKKNYSGSWKMATDPFSVVYTWAFRSDAPRLLAENLQLLREFAQDEQMLKNLQDSEKVNKHGRGTVLQEYASHNRMHKEKQYKLLNEPDGHCVADPRISEDLHNKNIKTFELESLVRFYKDWYRPDLQALIIVGNVDVGKVEGQVKAMFSDLKMPKNPREKSLHEFCQKMRISLLGKSQVITLTDSTRSDIELELYYKRPTTKINGTITTKEQYRRQLVEQLYNSMIHPRMASLTQQYNAPIQGGALHYLSTFPGVLQVMTAQTRMVSDVSSTREAFKLVMRRLEQVRRYGFTDTELEQAKEIALKEAVENIKGRTRLARQYHDHFLFGAKAPGLAYEREMASRMIEDITLEEVHAFAKQWLESPDRDVVFTVPKGIDHETLPGEADISRWIAEIRKADIAAYREQDLEGPKQLISEVGLRNLSEDIAYTQTEIEEVGGTRLELDNGVQLILKPVKTDGEGEIFLRGVSPVGSFSYEGQDYVTASMAADIVQNSGAGGWDKYELTRYNSDKHVSLSPRIGDHESYINGSASPRHLESMLQQLYLYVTEPNRHEAAFTDWLRQEKANLQRRNSRSGSGFYDLVNAELLGVEQHEVTLSDLERIQLDRALEIYKEVFSNAGRFMFVIAGDFEVEDIRPLLLRYLGNLPAGSGNAPTGTVAKDHQKITPQRGLHKTFYAGKEGYYICVSYLGNYDYDEQTNVKLDVIQQYLHRILIAKSKDAGLYWMIMMRGEYNDSYYRFMTVESLKDLAAMEKVEATVKHEVAKLREQGPDTTYFRNTILDLKSGLLRLLEQPSGYSWGNYLVEQHKKGGDLTAINRRLKLLGKMTPNDIREAACKYLTDDYLSIIKMLPESEKNRIP